MVGLVSWFEHGARIGTLPRLDVQLVHKLLAASRNVLQAFSAFHQQKNSWRRADREFVTMLLGLCRLLLSHSMTVQAQ